MVQWLRLDHAPNAGVSDSIQGQGTRSHMLQLRPGSAKQIFFFFKKEDTVKQTGHGSLKQTVKMMAVSVWKAKASAEALGRQRDWWVAGTLSTVYAVGETVGKQAKEGMGPH